MISILVTVGNPRDILLFPRDVLLFNVLYNFKHI